MQRLQRTKAFQTPHGLRRYLRSLSCFSVKRKSLSCALQCARTEIKPWAAHYYRLLAVLTSLGTAEYTSLFDPIMVRKGQQEWGPDLRRASTKAAEVQSACKAHRVTANAPEGVSANFGCPGIRCSGAATTFLKRRFCKCVWENIHEDSSNERHCRR